MTNICLLLRACERGDLKLVIKYLKTEIKQPTVMEMGYYVSLARALVIAVQKNYPKIVQVLLDDPRFGVASDTIFACLPCSNDTCLNLLLKNNQSVVILDHVLIAAEYSDISSIIRLWKIPHIANDAKIVNKLRFAMRVPNYSLLCATNCWKSILPVKRRDCVAMHYRFIQSDTLQIILGFLQGSNTLPILLLQSIAALVCEPFTNSVPDFNFFTIIDTARKAANQNRKSSFLAKIERIKKWVK